MATNIEVFGIIEEPTGLIVGISHNLAACNAVVENSLGLYSVIPHLQTREGYELVGDAPWKCRLDPDRKNILQHDYVIEEQKYKEIARRIHALNKVTRNLQWQKNKYKQLHNDFNELILLMREQQAIEFLNGSEEDLPYLREYADALNISQETAAKDIVIKSKIMHSDLAKIDGMRLRYTKKIFEADIDAIDDILIEFRKECWFNN